MEAETFYSELRSKPLWMEYWSHSQWSTHLDNGCEIETVYSEVYNKAHQVVDQNLLQ